MTDSPIAALQAEFAARASSDASATLVTGANVQLASWLHARLSTSGGVESVPSLNALRADLVQEGALVRFCGMIQDVRDPEFYNGTYEVVGPDGVAHTRTTKYQGDINEAPGVELRARSDEVWQRTPAVCVPIPARTGWLQKSIAGAQPASSSGAPPSDRSGKRGAADADDDRGGAAVDSTRAMEEDEAPKRPCAPGVAGAPTAPGAGVCVPCDGTRDGSGGAFVGAGAAASFAARAAASADGSVLLKLYDVVEAEELKVHELVEVYGLLERASEELVGDAGADDADMDLMLSLIHI